MKTRNTQPNDAIAYAQLLTHTDLNVLSEKMRELRGCLYT